ncbi:sulfatase-like hydrolase/transferase [Natronoglomus mannanivorans]|uniref:Sulfatase-like hydrolase/transferase n=1 Tax=Natronoglomus mannanivorans TaxID=2979990 RepID=A0AAP2Z1J2_9EURY|nr:sulfatase-like hydrolase/transferase [Halobacteria archaeon AArc-xg1-1]
MSSTDDTPNVVVFFTDQQRWDTAGCYGSPMDLTPTLDAMAERGTRLEQCVSSNPVCGPQRASLQTGQYPTECDLHHNLMSGEADSPIEDATTLADVFNDAGYQTGYVGKWHLANTRLEPVPERLRGGYEDYWIAADALEHTSHAYEGTLYDGDCEPVEFEDRYRVDFLTDCAERFLIEERDEDDPFFLFLSHLEPHHQNDRDTYDAPDGYAEEYANPWVPPDLEGRPGDWFEELPDYYGCCRRLDENLARVLEALESEGIADETIVLFTSDHGCHFRTRNREYKRSCHESSIRVPAVFQGPGFDGGVVVEEVTSLLDVPATLLEAAGLEVPDSFQGESVRPLAGERDEANEAWTDDALVQVSESAVERTLRTDRWTYSVYDPDGDPIEDPASDEYRERYLYDLRADPHQEVNLVGREDYREITEELRERLRERILEYEGSEVEIRAAEYPA